MRRIANALKRYAPPYVQFVDNEAQADVSVMYVIGFDYMDRANRLLAAGKQYVALQCCLRSTSYTHTSDWYEFWQRSALVWSYYNLKEEAAREGFSFYYSPLGVDDVFKQPFDLTAPRDIVLTTGYVQGTSQEALVEVWQAARQLGFRTVHVGPREIEGTGFHADEHVQPSDEELARLYRRARFTCSLRHTEGFELPAAEAVVCGSPAVVFDVPGTEWHVGPYVVWLDDCCGDALVDRLLAVFSWQWRRDESVVRDLSIDAQERFNWEHICTEFWQRLEAAIQEGAKDKAKEAAYAD